MRGPGSVRAVSHDHRIRGALRRSGGGARGAYACAAIIWLAAALGTSTARAGLLAPSLPTGARPLSVTLLRVTPLDRRPAGRAIAVIDARDGFGEPTRLPVLASSTGKDGVWLLVQMRFVRDFRGWVRAFPVSGVSGTLVGRMHGVARGRCHAKTGTLFFPAVSTLSGYCHTLHDGIVVFSILTNGVYFSWAQSLQDRAVAQIVRLG